MRSWSRNRTVPAVGVVEPAEDVEKRGLARSRRAEKHGKLALVQLELHAGEGIDLRTSPVS
jgi:hypothetical protein